MKIAIDRAALLRALSLVSGVVERRQTLPILGNLLIVADGEGLRLRATDLELEVATATAAAVKVGGATTVPARKLLDICRSLPEGAEMLLRVEGERAVIQSGRSRFLLGTLPAADFPTMEVGAVEVSVDLAQAVLQRLFDKTAFAMAQQDVRYYLNGVMLEFAGERITAVATDGHRLAKATAVIDEPAVRCGEGAADGVSAVQVIVPAKTVVELRRILAADGPPARLELSQRSLRLSVGSTVVTSKLVEGRYPEYERVIPKSLERTALIGRDALRSALQRTAILSSDKYKGVRVSFEAGNLGLSFQNQEKEEAEDALEVEYDGDATVVGFNVGYVLDVLSVVGTERVAVFFRDGESSAIWQGEDAIDETFVIMPMRL